MYSNYVLSKAFIENTNITLDNDVFNINLSKKEIKDNIKKISFLSQKLYFDCEIYELAKMYTISQKLTGYKKYLFLALLRRAMIRKLPYSRMNLSWESIVKLRDEDYSYKKYGRRRAYHNYPFEYHMKRELEEYNNAVFKNEECYSYNLDACEMLKKIDYVDIIYIDPPYPSTMNNYDGFYGCFDDIFNQRKQHLDFTKKKTFIPNLELLIQLAKNKCDYFVISYTTKACPSKEEIAKTLIKYGKLEIKKLQHNYKLTNKENKTSSQEVLFILKNKKEVN